MPKEMFLAFHGNNLTFKYWLAFVPQYFDVSKSLHEADLDKFTRGRKLA